MFDQIPKKEELLKIRCTSEYLRLLRGISKCGQTLT